VRSRGIVWAAYVFSGLCSGIAGLIISSNVTAADANSAGLWIELDAILAVVIGGTSLMGGRYSITGTIVGAFIIQTLTTTVYTAGIPKEVSLVFKAIVVILVCLLQSPVVQDWLHRRQRPLTPATISSTPTVTPTGAPVA
jgi:galactofuranose transport system permease protein